LAGRQFRKQCPALFELFFLKSQDTRYDFFHATTPDEFHVPANTPAIEH